MVTELIRRGIEPRVIPRRPSMLSGTYADITSYSANPQSAPAGGDISAVMIITNRASSPISITGEITYSYAGNTRTVNYSTATSNTVDAGRTMIVIGHFAMPTSNCAVTFKSYWFGSDNQWHSDAVQIAYVSVATSQAMLTVTNSPVTQGRALGFSYTGFHPNSIVYVSVQGGGQITTYSDASGNGSGSLTVNDSPGSYTLQANDNHANSAFRGFVIQAPPLTWNKLATVNKQLAGQPLTWSKLNTAQKNITPQTTAGWTKLNSNDIRVMVQASGGWTQLAQQNLGIKLNSIAGWTQLDVQTKQLQSGTEQPVIPENFKLISDHKYSAAKTYKGAAEKMVTKPFRINLPEQIGAWWLADKTVSAFEDTLKDQGLTILELKVYADTTPTWYTDFIIEVTTSLPQPPPNAVAFVQIPIAVWVALVALALLIALAIASTILVRSVTDLVWGPEGKGNTLVTILIAGGAVLAIGGIGYVIYRSQKGES